MYSILPLYPLQFYIISSCYFILPTFLKGSVQLFLHTFLSSSLVVFFNTYLPSCLLPSLRVYCLRSRYYSIILSCVVCWRSIIIPFHLNRIFLLFPFLASFLQLCMHFLIHNFLQTSLLTLVWFIATFFAFFPPNSFATFLPNILDRLLLHF